MADIIAGLGSLASGAASSAIGGAIQGAFNKKAAKRSYKYKKAWAVEGPSLTRLGLERAGINPIFAAGGIAAGATSSTPNVQGVGSSDPASSGAKVSKVGGEAALLKQQRLQSIASTAKETALTSKADIEQMLLQEQFPAAQAEGNYARTPIGRSTIQAARHMRYATDASPSVRNVLGTGVGLATEVGKQATKHAAGGLKFGQKLINQHKATAQKRQQASKKTKKQRAKAAQQQWQNFKTP